MASLPFWMGTLPQWLAATGIFGFIGIVLTHLRGLKQLEQSAAEGLRVHTDKELVRLQLRILDLEKQLVDRDRDTDERWRKLLGDSETRNGEADRRYKECTDERNSLEEKLTGLARQFAQFQRLTAQAIPPSAAVDEMLGRLEPYSGDTE